MDAVINIDDNKFGICECGEPKGFPVFYFHGFPGSRLDGEMFDFDTIGKDQGIRIISIDRPGIGYSTFQTSRAILDWPKDVLSIAKKLGLDKFSVLGLSGGGPYALACAYSIPERLNSVSFVSGMGPYAYNESLTGKAMLVPKQIGLIKILIAWGLKTGAMKKPEKLKENVRKTLPAVDLEFLNKSNNMDYLIDGFNESFRQGVKGYLYEARLYKRYWGFKPSEVNTQVFVWHGYLDNNVSIRLAKRMASEIPICRPRFIKNEGHFSIAGNYLKDILIEIKNSTCGIQHKCIVHAGKGVKTA